MSVGLSSFKGNVDTMRLTDLPVFELSGGERRERKSFLEWLTFELARLNILTLVVPPGNFPDSQSLKKLIREYDVIFVDGKMDISIQKIFLLPVSSEKTEDVLCCRLNDKKNLSEFLDLFLARLQEISQKTPVWGCILIGGKSSRMGQPKHLIMDGCGKTWLEHSVAILKPFVDGIVISGAGTLPGSLTGTPRLADIPGVVGPLTGILAAVRWLPQVSWLLIACDMPHISAEAVEWLLSYRRPGCWGCVPRMTEVSHFEPLFACYDTRTAGLFERQAQSGEMRMSSVARHPKINNPVIPELLRYGWENVNTPEQLQGIERMD